MHVLIINFRLADMHEEGYRAACAEMAPVRGAPGPAGQGLAGARRRHLRRRLPLPRQRVHGGLPRPELFATVAAFPHFTDIVARDFGVYDLTRVTEPGLTVVAPVGASG